jgi:hypothetical protein
VAGGYAQIFNLTIHKYFQKLSYLHIDKHLSIHDTRGHNYTHNYVHYRHDNLQTGTGADPGFLIGGGGGEQDVLNMQHEVLCLQKVNFLLCNEKLRLQIAKLKGEE